MSDAITFRDIEAAARRLEGHAVRTPLLRHPDLDRRTGAKVFLKAEPLQRTGSFKFRGAFNRIAQIDPTETRHVVAFSSGNHGQAVAAAARHFGFEATVVMPSDAPRIKVELTQSHGAEIVLYDRFGEDRDAIAATIMERTGAVLVPPYDDPAVMAGQGTIGLEITQDLAALGLEPEVLLSCCGGGGLMAGLAVAFKELAPRCRLHTVEPDGFDDTARSLKAGERLRNTPGRTTICDAIMTPQPGALTFPINQDRVASGLSVTDREVEEAMRYAALHLKLVVEPGGVAALAALLAGKTEFEGKVAVAVLSGGNLDLSLFARVLGEG